MSKKYKVQIDEALYKEILRARDNMQKNRKGKKRVTILETTRNMGEYLNNIRNSKIFRW